VDRNYTELAIDLVKGRCYGIDVIKNECSTRTAPPWDALQLVCRRYVRPYPVRGCALFSWSRRDRIWHNCMLFLSDSLYWVAYAFRCLFSVKSEMSSVWVACYRTLCR